MRNTFVLAALPIISNAPIKDSSTNTSISVEWSSTSDGGS